MPYDPARLGPTVTGYYADFDLGYQRIRPLLLDDLNRRLADRNVSWNYVKFVAANQDQIPSAAGVYFFIVHPHAANIEYHSIILYFGESKNLNARYKEYLEERYGIRERDREHIANMLTIYRNRIYFGFCCLDQYDVEEVQDILIEAFSPCCNRKASLSQPAF